MTFPPVAGSCAGPRPARRGSTPSGSCRGTRPTPPPTGRGLPCERSPPALFTRMSIPPNEPATASTASATLSRRRTSIENISARTPSASAPRGFPEAPPRPGRTAPGAPGLRQPQRHRAPPSPFDAPVTKRAFPVRSNRVRAHTWLHSHHQVFPDDFFDSPRSPHPPPEPDRPFSRGCIRGRNLPAELQVSGRRAENVVTPLPVNPAEHFHQVRTTSGA